MWAKHYALGWDTWWWEWNLRHDLKVVAYEFRRNFADGKVPKATSGAETTPCTLTVYAHTEKYTARAVLVQPAGGNAECHIEARPHEIYIFVVVGTNKEEFTLFVPNELQ